MFLSLLAEKEYNSLRVMKGDAVMGFSRGPKEPVKEVDTTIWACTNDECKGWMRESYSFEKDPKCPLCQSSMKQEVRVLPEIK